MAKSSERVPWGELNAALNGLRRQGIIQSYSTGIGKSSAALVEVMIDAGADQAEVVARVRDALPAGLADAQVRTRMS